MYARGRGITRKVIDITSVVAAALLASFAYAQDTEVTGTDVTPQGIAPITTCDTAGIGQAHLVSDLPTAAFTNPPNDTSVTIFRRGYTTGTTGGIPYCLVKLLVKPAINIWVGLPMGGNWNGRLQSEGGGGYAGSVGIPTGSIAAGYIGVQTDTGHTGGSGTFGCVNDCAGATQASPGIDGQAAPKRLRLSVRAFDGRARQAACAGVLWPASGVLVLERLLDRRAARSSDGAAVPERLQRHSCRRAGDTLGSFPGVPDLAADDEEYRNRRRRAIRLRS